MSEQSTPAAVGLVDELGPLPSADGTAETNKERHPEGGYTFDEVDAWSEPLVRAYAAAEVARAVAAERKRCTKVVSYWLAGQNPKDDTCEARCLEHLKRGLPLPDGWA